MNDVKTIRVTFRKLDGAKYISHLDLMRTMTRVLRRAQIPLWYTEGFSKHPYITFAAPLSLGFEGLNETMDFRLEGEMSTDEIVRRLNANMPRGLEVVSAAPAEMKAGEIAKASWRLTFDKTLEPRFRQLFAQEEILVQKRTKKKTFKTIDLKPLILSVEWNEDENGSVNLLITLPCGENNVNPSLVAEAAGVDIAAVRVVRIGTYNSDGKLFQ